MSLGAVDIPLQHSEQALYFPNPVLLCILAIPTTYNTSDLIYLCLIEQTLLQNSFQTIDQEMKQAYLILSDEFLPLTSSSIQTQGSSSTPSSTPPLISSPRQGSDVFYNLPCDLTSDFESPTQYLSITMANPVNKNFLPMILTPLPKPTAVTSVFLWAILLPKLSAIKWLSRRRIEGRIQAVYLELHCCHWGIEAWIWCSKAFCLEEQGWQEGWCW